MKKNVIGVPMQSWGAPFEITDKMLTRFWAKVVIDCACDCWIWTAERGRNGYGRFQINRRLSCLAHRFAYQAWKGPIERGRHISIDHLCRVRACVNPSHMEVVTRRENILRGCGVTARNARRSSCKHGHEFTPENTYLYMSKRGPQRHCRTCRRDYVRVARELSN